MHIRLSDEAGRLASLRRYDLLDTSPEAPFDKITQLVKTVLNVPIALVSLVDADRQWFKSCIGLEVRETARDISFCTHTIKSRQPMVINDAALDPRFALNPLVVGPPFIASYAGAPLLTPDGYALGSLCAIDTVPRQFEPWQIDVLTSFAALVVGEFELRRLAQTDSLTGAHSRRALLAEAERAISQFSRHHLPSALVSLDIDQFKTSNDLYGHATGDTILCACAAYIHEYNMPGDMLARLGGDEFALLLTDTDSDQAVLAAERCRAALALLRFEHDPELRITASFGVAALHGGCRSAEQWLAEADAALFEAKRTGRNKICIHEAPPESLEIAPPEMETEEAPPAIQEEPLEDEASDAEFELHKTSVEPLSRGLWAKMQRLNRVKMVKSGRMAFGGLFPGMVNFQVLNLSETGIIVETSSKLTPVPDFFSVEFCEIYSRARTCRSAGFVIELEFIFDGE